MRDRELQSPVGGAGRPDGGGVIAIKSDIDASQQTVYACEVVTHMDGKLYSGSMPDTDRWREFGNKDYQHSLDKLWTKFNNDHRYVRNTFEEAKRIGTDPCQDCLDRLGGTAAKNFSR